jgi:hypothetical protein
VPSKPAPALQNDYSAKMIPVEIGMPAALLEERLNQWLTGIYEHREHDGLNGITPFAKAAGMAKSIA